jgi:hypothetical protein
MMGYKVNKKNLAVTRLMPRGPRAEKRLKYMHASAKGTVCLTPAYLVRVGLPEGECQPQLPRVYRQEDIDTNQYQTSKYFKDDVFDVGEGRPAGTGPEFLIPRIDDAIPDPADQTASFTCNGETLLKMLKIANEVCTDSEKPVTLRFYGNDQHPTDPTRAAVLRIDTFCQPGEQEFLGVLKGMEYYGNLIPGNRPSDAPVKEEKPRQITETLRVATGRRFR